MHAICTQHIAFCKIVNTWTMANVTVFCPEVLRQIVLILLLGDPSITQYRLIITILVLFWSFGIVLKPRKYILFSKSAIIVITM